MTTTFFYSIKGGQGKTTHAVGYAKHAGWVLVTNDLDTGTTEIYNAALWDRRIFTLQPGQSLASFVKRLNSEATGNTAPLVIDFWGFVEARIIEAAKLADITVVPLSYQSTADLTPAVKTITALQPHARQMLILINNTAPEHVADLKTILAIRFPKMPVLVVNRSRHISRLADDGLTVFDIADLGGIERYQLRNILPQVAALYKFIDQATRS